MELVQRAHIDAVMRLAGEGLPLSDGSPPDRVIRESWSRCVHEHRGEEDDGSVEVEHGSYDRDQSEEGH